MPPHPREASVSLNSNLCVGGGGFDMLANWTWMVKHTLKAGRSPRRVEQGGHGPEPKRRTKVTAMKVQVLATGRTQFVLARFPILCFCQK